MKSKSRFLWLYTILLFSVALLLILFAGMTQQNYEEELETHETASVGLQKSVTDLTQVNENLKAEIATLRAEADAVNTLKASLEQSAQYNANNELLMKAMSAFYSNDYKGSRELLTGMDTSQLTPEQFVVYDKLMK